ncbi:hypothetical protein BN9982_970001 [Mycobacterium tuberculosis]|nr:hypothetical protein BN9982_970001 [Mycobacterium tuberculosis]
MLGLPALNSIPLRVDCGTSDRFYFATRQFVNPAPTPAATPKNSATPTTTHSSRHVSYPPSSTRASSSTGGRSTSV